MRKVLKYVLYDILRNKFLLGYTILLLILSGAFFGFEVDPGKGIISILNINLIVIPLVSIVFSTTHFYNSYEYLELLSAQPLSRKTIFFSQYLGVSITLILAFLVGVGLPVIIYNGDSSGIRVILTGILLTLVYVSLAFLAAVFTRDKAKGIGLSLVIWFYFSLVYDSLVLALFLNLSDYPMEKITVLFSLLNPSDLARILVLIKLDVSALMGITGAVFQDFFGSTNGLLISFLALISWFLVPLIASFRIFNKKDL
ncbi:ABC transporter permease [Lacihabitans sp. LS3-19]|uniref:ABC transporter permease n=1 Tax=Lacihabitans sp. LS3-19 TaxID=2487335 RepID=UPI0020CD0949|nr:ABC transporter permease subunit [Lacihabitans sp. LS3-19]MCP9770653.1 ABC transporter permease [Lacihabitans sp. LS3-19]